MKGQSFRHRTTRAIINPDGRSSILYPRSSILYPQCSILYPRSSILYPQCSILYPRSSILDPQCSILYPRSSILYPLFSFAVRALLLLALALTAGCRQDMHDQPKYRPLRAIDPFGSIKDERSARPLVEGTVARGHLRDDVEFYTGKLAGATSSVAPQPQGAAQAASQGASQTYQGFVTEFPIAITAADLDRGQDRFNISCALCHGLTGEGNGMIVRRGFRRPPSYDEERLRQAPVGYLFDVITNGFGTMPEYASEISPEDRWKIVAYVRALQLSARGTVADVPADQRVRLSSGAKSQGEDHAGGTPALPGGAPGEHR
jgi:mono/diheme cytochrome c family protein